MLEEIKENNIINHLTAGFLRSPLKQNGIHESDAEIVKMNTDSDETLAITMDSISEEIETGLYDDPWLLGWMLVMVNFSDIAAVGAAPLGIVISEILTSELEPEFTDKIQAGIGDAVKACGTFVLGGDTNSGAKLILTGCAIGKSSDNKYMKRVGCKPGDMLYTTYKPGRGNAFAVSKLLCKGNPGLRYEPQARLKEATVIRKYASACIDTSDGLLAGMDQLMRLNKCGFIINNPLKEIIDTEAAALTTENNIPEWMLLAGEHGDFELLFTIPAVKESEFLSCAHNINWSPVKLGEVNGNCDIRLNIYNKITTIDSGKLRNLPTECNGDILKYFNSLLEYDTFL